MHHLHYLRKQLLCIHLNIYAQPTLQMVIQLLFQHTVMLSILPYISESC